MPDRGAERHPVRSLAPADIGVRLDRMLGFTEALIASVPVPYVEHRARAGDWTLRDLAYHVFRLSLAFADGMDTGRLRDTWLDERTPADLADGGAVARYGALVRGRVGGWLEGAGAGEYERVIEGPSGPVSGRALLERTARHAALHVRQLCAQLEDIGLAPPEPPPAADLASLCAGDDLCARSS